VRPERKWAWKDYPEPVPETVRPCLVKSKPFGADHRARCLSSQVRQTLGSAVARYQAHALVLRPNPSDYRCPMLPGILRQGHQRDTGRRSPRIQGPNSLALRCDFEYITAQQRPGPQGCYGLSSPRPPLWTCPRRRFAFVPLLGHRWQEDFDTIARMVTKRLTPRELRMRGTVNVQDERAAMKTRTKPLTKTSARG
jgi:hypothetical protein